MKSLEKSQGIRVEDLNDGENRHEMLAIVSSISATAKRHALEVYSCAEKIDLSPFSVSHGACIDQNLINNLFGLALKTPKDKS